MKRRGFFKLLGQGLTAVGLTKAAQANPFLAKVEPQVKEVTRIPKPGRTIMVPAQSAGGAGGVTHAIIYTGSGYCLHDPQDRLMDRY